MGSLEKRYTINGYHKIIYFLTAKQLCNRVLSDSKSDYNWIAPARELVRICKKAGFPVKYSIPIKVAILNCFANIEHMANCGGDRYYKNPDDEIAVQYCYNSLYGINSKKSISARKQFLTEMIATASYVSTIFDSLYHPGPTFQKLRENWRKSKFDKYISHKRINFKQLIKTLRSDFVETVKVAESNGAFVADEKENTKKMKQLFDQLGFL